MSSLYTLILAGGSGTRLWPMSRQASPKQLISLGRELSLFQETVSRIRNKVEPVRNILDFGFYVSFFPQLVAGPIVRAADFIPQLYKNFQLTRFEFGLAVFWIFLLISIISSS